MNYGIGKGKGNQSNRNPHETGTAFYQGDHSLRL